MQHRKDKADAGIALGVVTDANVLKLITKELPSWFYESETERVEVRSVYHTVRTHKLMKVFETNADTGVALGVVTDTNVLQLVNKKLPSSR